MVFVLAASGCGDQSIRDARGEQPTGAAGPVARSIEQEVDEAIGNADAQERREESKPSTPEEQRSGSVEDQLDSREKAAREGDRDGVAAAERELDELAKGATSKEKSSAQDPYFRALDEFVFKAGPLYVQQITTSQDDHVLFVGVQREAYCLLAPDRRVTAANAVYLPMHGRLVAEKIDDLEFLVVPVTETTPTRDSVLARGSGGKLKLTARGEKCARPG